MIRLNIYVGKGYPWLKALGRSDPRWSLFTAEYVDIWLTSQTADTGRLAGH